MNPCVNPCVRCPSPALFETQTQTTLLNLKKALNKEFWKGIGEREGERRKKGIGGIGEGHHPLI
jgi:hypothetical protein